MSEKAVAHRKKLLETMKKIIDTYAKDADNQLFDVFDNELRSCKEVQRAQNLVASVEREIKWGF